MARTKQTKSGSRAKVPRSIKETEKSAGARTIRGSKKGVLKESSSPAVVEAGEYPPFSAFGVDYPWQQTRWRYLLEQDKFLTKNRSHFEIAFRSSSVGSFSFIVPKFISSRAVAEAVAAELMHTALAITAAMVDNSTLWVRVDEDDGVDVGEAVE